jgi:uncharacterized membrane protein
MMNDRNTASPKPPFRWGRAVLFVSLALNLAVLGVVGGAVLERFGHEREGFAAREVGFGLFSEALEEKDRKDLRRAYLAARPDGRADRKRMRQDFQTILSALRAEPFDGEALRAALTAGATRIAERQAVGQSVMLDYLAKMPAAERAAFADRLEARLKRHPRGSKPPHKPDE